MYDFSPTREAQFLDTAVVYVSHIPLRPVSEQTGMIYFSSTSYLVEYSSITACLQHYYSIFYTARREP